MIEKELNLIIKWIWMKADLDIKEESWESMMFDDAKNELKNFLEKRNKN